MTIFWVWYRLLTVYSVWILWIRPCSERSSFWLRHVGYARIIHDLGASCGVFIAVCDTRPLPCWRSALRSGWSTGCKAGVEKPHIQLEGDTHLVLNIMKTLDISRLDLHNVNLFKKDSIMPLHRPKTTTQMMSNIWIILALFLYNVKKCAWLHVNRIMYGIFCHGLGFFLCYRLYF